MEKLIERVTTRHGRQRGIGWVSVVVGSAWRCKRCGGIWEKRTEAERHECEAQEKKVAQ